MAQLPPMVAREPAAPAPGSELEMASELEVELVWAGVLEWEEPEASGVAARCCRKARESPQYRRRSTRLTACSLSLIHI